MRSTHALLIVVAVLAGAAAFGAAGHAVGAPAAQRATSLPIAVGSTPPSDIVPSAPTATLPQAAAFAWNEFFALNWTAKTTDAGGNSLRETPDSTCAFGNPSCGKNRPLVWMTYRGKVEIFPGSANPPASYVNTPPSYGYDGGPSYVYASPQPPACPNQAAVAAPWVNLDETDEIKVVSMYAGAGPTPVPSASPGTTNSQPQLIRFVAKANRAFYAYVEGYQLWTGSSNFGPPTANSPDPSPAVPPYTGTAPAPLSLPNGTIETKSGWRPLTQTEASSGRFITAPVRYYETSNGQASGRCWRQGTFGLMALHIIQKTPTAPYFVYATFEQADNILTADGTHVEDDNGTMSPHVGAPGPTTPLTALDDVTTPLPAGVSIPPRIDIVAHAPTVCPAHGKRLYYLKESGRKALPAGVICVNRRENPIPQDVISANAAAHTALANYEAAHGSYHSPFEHYKLINVQYAPIDKKSFGPYTGPAPATFSQANIVVETNHSLQLFSGGLVGGLGRPTGSNSDNPGIFAQSLPGKKTYNNVFYNSQTYNMGGCMGCHGAAGQQNGGDFSVILVEGSVLVPEYPAPIMATGMTAPVPRNRSFARPIKAHY